MLVLYYKGLTMVLLHIRLDGSSSITKVNINHEIRTQMLTFKNAVVHKADAGDYTQSSYKVHIPFLTGFEIVSSQGINHCISIPQDPEKKMTSTYLNTQLKAERIPEEFECQVFTDNGITPTDAFSTIDLYFEYHSNSLFF